MVRLVEREAGAEKAPEEERLELAVHVLSGKQSAMEISMQDMYQEALLEPEEGKEAGSDPGEGGRPCSISEDLGQLHGEL